MLPSCADASFGAVVVGGWSHGLDVPPILYTHLTQSLGWLSIMTTENFILTTLSLEPHISFIYICTFI